MFPLFHIGPYIEVHMFGLSLVIAWAVFFWLLQKYGAERGISKTMFQNIALYTASIFFWSRIFYILTDWRNEKYLFIDFIEGSGLIDFLKGFFITDNYNLSLAGGLFGFLTLFAWKIYSTRAKIGRNIDVLVRAFFYAGIIWYFGTLLGGQIYGAYFDSFFSLLYTDKNSIVPVGSARFPLPIIYMIICLCGILLIEKIQRSIRVPDGFIGYIGFGFFGIALFLFEFLSGSADMFASYPPYIGVNQIVGLMFALFGLVWILKSTKI